MSAAIVYYSETGNTHSVVQMTLKRLTTRGVRPDIFRLKPLVKLNPGMKDAEFECLPDLSSYESILFASPVQAFSLAPAMSIYLAKSGPLKDRLPRAAVAFCVDGRKTGLKAAGSDRFRKGRANGTVLYSQLVQQVTRHDDGMRRSNGGGVPARHGTGSGRRLQQPAEGCVT